MALVPPGIDKVIQWIALNRKWNPQEAERKFLLGLTVLFILLTSYHYVINVFTNQKYIGWNNRLADFQKVENYLETKAEKEDPIFVNRTGDYWVATRRPTLMPPHEGIKAITEAAKDWDVSWLIIHETSQKLYWEATNQPHQWEQVATFTDSLGQHFILFHLKS
jgi:hypothetical protein